MSFHPAVRPLWQPVRLAVIGHHFGQLALVLAALLLVPTVFAAASGDWPLARCLLLAAVLPALVLAAGVRLSSGEHPLQVNEALVVTALAFVVSALLMTLPLAAGGLSTLDAWFEAVSGVTTTGLSVVAEPEQQSRGFLFARAWAQWFGGLGIVVLSLSLAFASPADRHRLADPLGEEDNLAEGIRRHARRVLTVYALLTLAGLGLVWAAGLPFFDALTHTLAAVSTGGFSGFADSLARLDRATQLALLLVAFLSALPLPLFYRAYVRGLGLFWRDVELRALAVAVGMVTVGLWLLSALSPADALVQALSAQTTAGFASVDLAELEPQAKLLLIGSMVTGGGIGSTAGGMKLLRLLILIRVIQLTILRVQLPRHAVVHPTLGGRTLEAVQIEHALLLLLLFPLVVMVCWLPFVVAGYPPIDALFEVVSAVGTVGLSVGITGADLEPGLKQVLALGMLLGRVEILALVVLVYPGTWIKRG